MGLQPTHIPDLSSSRRVNESQAQSAPGGESFGSLLDRLYEAWDGNQMVEEYSERHDIDSAAILTVTDDETADLIAAHLSDRILGKIVVEIGGGIGLLAFHLSQYAERVFVIEANPAWTFIYVAFMYANKPKNVTFIFGSADEVASFVRADVAIFCTHSGAASMRDAGHLFASEVIDVYGEIVPLLKPDLAALNPLRQ